MNWAGIQQLWPLHTIIYGEYKLRMMWLEERQKIRFKHRSRYPAVFVDMEVT
jgi:hypothetical protein